MLRVAATKSRWASAVQMLLDNPALVQTDNRGQEIRNLTLSSQLTRD